MIIMNIDDSLAIKPRTTNWEEPAKTNDDSAKAPYIERLIFWDRVPYIIPNGMAPIIRGIVSITPLVNSIFDYLALFMEFSSWMRIITDFTAL